MNWRELSIALVGPLPPPAGGMASQVMQFADHLRAEGCTVKLVNSAAKSSWAIVESIPGLRTLVHLIAYVGTLWKALRDADIVHVMANSGWAWYLVALPAVMMSRARRVPCVVHYHGGAAADFLSRSRRRVVPTLKSVDALVVPSPYLAEVFDRYGIAADVVPNVLDASAFCVARRREASTHRIAVTRNLEPMYDVATALRAFARLREQIPDARLFVAGTGSEAERLRDLVRELNLDLAVTFTGHLDRGGVLRLLQTSDVLLNPSTVDNLPVSLIEAMAAGVPIVSTNVGGIPYLLSDGETALLVPPGDAQAMGEAAVRVLTDEALRTRLTSTAMSAAQRFTWPLVGAVLSRVYERVLPKQARAAIPC